ncbi:hypothetical protein GCM10009099_33270 [Caenispirillum bisanense]
MHKKGTPATKAAGVKALVGEQGKGRKVPPSAGEGGGSRQTAGLADGGGSTRGAGTAIGVAAGADRCRQVSPQGGTGPPDRPWRMGAPGRTSDI